MRIRYFSYTCSQSFCPPTLTRYKPQIILRDEDNAILMDGWETHISLGCHIFSLHRFYEHLCIFMVYTIYVVSEFLIPICTIVNSIVSQYYQQSRVNWVGLRTKVVPFTSVLNEELPIPRLTPLARRLW